MCLRAGSLVCVLGRSLQCASYGGVFSVCLRAGFLVCVLGWGL